jgi:hypothetical protein
MSNTRPAESVAPSDDIPNRMPRVTSSRRIAAAGLLDFDLPAIFRCAVELAAAVCAETALHPEGEVGAEKEWKQWESGDPKARQQLRERVEASRQCETAMVRLMAVLNPSGAEFPRQWQDAVNLADATAAARQALLALGLALADLRGAPQWHERGWMLLSAGTQRLWDQMEEAERKAVRQLLPETYRLWDWRARPRGEPAQCTRPLATILDQRVLTTDWRTVLPGQPDRRQGSGLGLSVAARWATRRSARPPGKRGRKALAEGDERKRSDLIALWHQFRDSKTGTKKDFCKDQKIAVKELNKALAWQRGRHRRAQE